MLFQPVLAGRGEFVVRKRQYNILLSLFGSAFPLRFVRQTLYIFAPVLGTKIRADVSRGTCRCLKDTYLSG